MANHIEHDIMQDVITTIENISAGFGDKSTVKTVKRIPEVR